jgi:putative transposase
VLNSPTERFFSGLKREWLTGNTYQTRESAIADTYTGYCNTQRIHTTIGDMTPIEFEK